MGDLAEAEREKLLKDFQCDYNRSLEEDFAQTFSENEKARLFFINENAAFTDGRNIVVDPALDDLYVDQKALLAVEEYLGWEPYFSSDPWMALRMITRAQTIHECLHLLYSVFPPEANRNPRCDTKKKKEAMALISNIIEDAYIEAVGSSIYDNTEHYLKFGRVSRLFLTHASEGSAERMFKRKGRKRDFEEKRDPVESGEAIIKFLDYMATMLLYPMVRQSKPEELIRSYVEKSKALFMEGSGAASPKERDRFAREIFEIILPIIPEDEDAEISGVSELLGGIKTHLFSASAIRQIESEGRVQVVSTRLFRDFDGGRKAKKDEGKALHSLIGEWSKEREKAYALISYTGQEVAFFGGGYDCSVLHKSIKISQIHPKINLSLKKAYHNIRASYQMKINSYNTKFTQLLKARMPVREEGYLFGSGIASRRLGDIKKRYWYRVASGVEVPELAIMLLIDGSGSMYGARRNAAIQSAVILHEVLKKQGIEHAIVEHRAYFEEPKVDMNILVDWNARDEQKYNLLQIKAEGNNRDGLALFWAERYMQQNTNCHKRLIIVISDGFPEHRYDDYYPPVSVRDTANAVAKISGRGSDIIAVALDDSESFSCYEALKSIYPDLIACNDLGRLPGQILALISRRLSS